MQLPRFSGKLRRPKLLIRRIVGSSMSPNLEPGQLVIGLNLFVRIHPGEVYIFRHDGMEKIKRVERVSRDRVFFIGDNMPLSSDSRHFGWVDKNHLIAKVVWPRVHN